MKPTPKTDAHTTDQPSPTRRKIVQTAAWIVPAVVTLTVTPSFAAQTSGRPS